MLLPVRALKGIHPLSFCADPLYIYLPVEYAVLKEGSFTHYLSVLRDHVVAAEDQILGGLSFSRGGIYIAGHQPCGKGGYHQPSEFLFGNQLVTGGKIHYKLRSV